MRDELISAELHGRTKALGRTVVRGAHPGAPSGLTAQLLPGTAIPGRFCSLSQTDPIEGCLDFNAGPISQELCDTKQVIYFLWASVTSFTKV